MRKNGHSRREGDTLLGEEMVFTSYPGTYSQGCSIAF